MRLWIKDRNYPSLNELRQRVERLTPASSEIEKEELASCWAIILGHAVYAHCSDIARQGGDNPYDGVLSTIGSVAYSLSGSIGSVPPTSDLRRKHVISNKLRKQVYERDAYRCKYCETWLDLSVDHIIPITRGGETTLDNLQTLCMRCNITKGNRMEENNNG